GSRSCGLRVLHGNWEGQAILSPRTCRTERRRAVVNVSNSRADCICPAVGRVRVIQRGRRVEGHDLGAGGLVGQSAATSTTGQLEGRGVSMLMPEKFDIVKISEPVSPSVTVVLL